MHGDAILSIIQRTISNSLNCNLINCMMGYITIHRWVIELHVSPIQWLQFNKSNLKLLNITWFKSYWSITLMLNKTFILLQFVIILISKIKKETDKHLLLNILIILSRLVSYIEFVWNVYYIIWIILKFESDKMKRKISWSQDYFV